MYNKYLHIRPGKYGRDPFVAKKPDSQELQEGGRIHQRGQFKEFWGFETTLYKELRKSLCRSILPMVT